LGQVRGWLSPWPALDGPIVHAAGMVLCAVGIASTLWAQLAMGNSWRVGVDASERTALVASGPFGLVRNPIYTSMLLGMAGVALLVPKWMGAVAMAPLPHALTLAVCRCAA